MNSSKKISAILCGAGNRGKDIYGVYALQHPEDIEFVAIAEPNPIRRNEFATIHNIPQAQVQSVCLQTILWELVNMCL